MLISCLSTLCAVVLCAGTLHGQTRSGTPQSRVPQDPTKSSGPVDPSWSAAHKYFSDVELVDQNGKRLRFYSDLLKGHTVVIDAFFANCTGICPPMNRNLERVQDALGDRLGREVFLISITVDPLNDTPEKLKEYATRFHAKPGWYFITGKKENVEWALHKLGHYVADKNDHTSILIVGNETTGLWKKLYGLAKAEDIVKSVEETANDKSPAN